MEKLSSGRPRHAIVDFWEWWPSARPRLTASIAGDGGASLADEIGERAATIHPELDWELGKGQVARHGFTLSPAARLHYYVDVSRRRVRGWSARRRAGTGHAAQRHSTPV